MAIQPPEGTRDLLPDEAKFWAHFKAVAADIFGATATLRLGARL